MIQKIPSRTRHRWRIAFWSGCLHRCGMKPTLIRGFGRHLMTSWAPCLPLIHPGPHIHHGPGAIFTLMSSYALRSQLDPYPRCWLHILESAWMDRGPTAYGPDVLPLWRWYGEDLGEGIDSERHMQMLNYMAISGTRQACVLPLILFNLVLCN